MNEQPLAKRAAVCLVCLFLVAGCVSHKSINARIGKDEAAHLELYKNAADVEVVEVLKQYLAKADEYDARGWNKKGVRTDAIRAMTEARLAAFYRDVGDAEKSLHWIQRAVEHQHVASGSTNATAEDLLCLVDVLDQAIDPKWRKDLTRFDKSVRPENKM